MISTARKRRTKRFNIRATDTEDQLIRAAAELRGVNVTHFILESARQQAEMALLDQRHFVLPEGKWQEFVRMLDGPAKPKPALQELFARKSVPETDPLESKRPSLRRRETRRRA